MATQSYDIIFSQTYHTNDADDITKGKKIKLHQNIIGSHISSQQPTFSKKGFNHDQPKPKCSTKIVITSYQLNATSKIT